MARGRHSLRTSFWPANARAPLTAMEWFESLKVDSVQPAARRWSRWDSLVAAILAITLAAMLACLFFPLWRQQRAMDAQLRQLDRELTSEMQRSRQLSREVNALQTDRAYIERVAREKLNLVAPGETIFQFGTTTAPPNRHPNAR